MKYINSKFLYIDYNIRTQMKSMYKSIINRMCIIEQEVLRNTLDLAENEPDQIAYRIMKKRGYIGVVRGEVIHILKCDPLSVTVRNSSYCYKELPVLKNNNSYGS